MRRVFVKPRRCTEEDWLVTSGGIPVGTPLVVKDELLRVIPGEGKVVNYSTHISRLVKAGDLEVVEKPKPAKKEKGGK
jgi:hypothetical protein